MKLCVIGLHDWEKREIWRYEMEHCVAVLEGDACKHCGEVRGGQLDGLPTDNREEQ